MYYSLGVIMLLLPNSLGKLATNQTWVVLIEVRKQSQHKTNIFFPNKGNKMKELVIRVIYFTAQGM